MQNNHKLPIIIFTILTMILTFLNAFAYFSSFAEEKKEEKNSTFLSLEKAQEEAIKNAVLLKGGLRNIEAFNDEHSQAYSEERAAKKNKDDYGGTLEYFQYESGYKTKEVDIKINNTKLKMKKDEEKIKLEVLSAYQDILLNEKEIEIEKEEVAYEKKLLEIAKIKSERGNISLYEFEKTKNDYETRILSLDSKNQELENAYKRLNFLRGASLDDRPKLSMTSLSSLEDKLIDTKAALQIANENRYDLLSSKSELTLSEMDLKNTSIVYPENTYRYKEKERIVSDAKEKYEETKDSLEEEIETAYADLLISKLKNDDIKLALEIMKKGVEEKELLLKYGRISEMELEKAKKDFSAKELEYMRNTFEYQKLLKEYILTYTLGK